MDLTLNLYVKVINAQKKSFPLRISSVNVTKSAGNYNAEYKK